MRTVIIGQNVDFPDTYAGVGNPDAEGYYSPRGGWRKKGIPPVQLAPITNFVAVGDSQTVGGGWADATITDLASVSIAGSKVAQGSRQLGIPTDNNTVNSGWGHIQEVKDSISGATGRTIVAYFMGHNDLATYKGLGTGAARAAAYYTDTLAYFAALKAVNPNTIIIWIIPTTATSAFGAYVDLNAGVQALRPLVRAGAGVDGFEAFADFGAHPAFVDDIVTNLSADGLHIGGVPGATYLRDVLRSVIDGFIVPQTGNTPSPINLGVDVANAAQNASQYMDTMIRGLGPRQSIFSATATGGQVKQGFGAYADSIGSGQLFNGDVVRSKHITSANPATQTSYSLTLEPGARTDSRNFTTAAVTARATLTQWVAQHGLVISNSGQTAESTSDGGGSPHIKTNQPIIAGRRNYWELTFVSGSSPQGASASLVDPSVDMFVFAPGLSGYEPGITYIQGGYVALDGGYKDDNTPNHQPMATWGPGDTIGIASRDNGDGTSTVWFLDKNGNLLQQSTQAQTLWTGTGWNVATDDLYPSIGVRGTDKVTANWSGPFVHQSAAQLAAANAKPVDMA